jgi:glycosyltransferase involved in cell wall biosynthesis
MKTSLRIAQISPLAEAVPPRLYGGTERVVAHLTDSLVDRGHDVTLFASGDTRTSARLVAARDRAIRLDPSKLKSEVAAHLAMLHEVRLRAHEFDVMHFHVDLLHYPIFERVAHRTLTTLHGRLDVPDLAEVYRRWHAFPLVSISNSQRRPLPRANWFGNVHHGIPSKIYDFSPTHSGYVAFIGRISPEKRPDRAIEIALRASIPLKIAAKVDRADKVYFQDVIEPLLQEPGVEFLGEIHDAAKSDLLGGAAALLFPIDWPEPFGLVMIEAMACGTPVVAWDAGSTREIVDEGVTGFVVDSVDDAVSAVHRAAALDRARVRRCFERRFSAETMAEHYLGLYSRLTAPGFCREHNDLRLPRRYNAATAGAVGA